MKLKNVKDRLKDETLDLSLCDLEDVPVREIATVRKATHLDLSNNLLVSLPSTFISLKQIVKLDLSKNMLTEIPENFGEMKQLKHLDLYANQISRLPLSLSELKNLRWLDLKENPLTPAVASVAGPCSNLSECQACARNIVAYLSRVKLAIEEEKTRRQNIITDTDADTASSKKENKKKKKKSGEKEGNKSLEKNGTKPSDKSSRVDGNEAKESKSTSNHKNTIKSRGSKGKSGLSLPRTLASIVARCLLFFLVFVLTMAILPLYSKKQSEILTNYLEARTGMPVKTFQKNSTDMLYLIMEVASAWSRNIYAVLNDTYERHIKGSVNVP